MNTEELKTFIYLSKVKNFTLAAEQLFIAQSTVTNRISELEKEVGKRLFSRGSKTVTLTEAGEIFLRYAERILEFFHLFKVKRTYCPKKKSDYQMYRLNIPLYAKSTENLYGGVIKSVF